MKKSCTLLFLSFMLASLVNTLSAQQPDQKLLSGLIRKNAASLGLSSNDLQNYRVSDAYNDATSGLTMVYLQQTFKGIDVFNSLQTIAFKNDRLVSIAGNRIGAVEDLVNVKEAKATLGAADAIRSAAKHLKLAAPSFMVPLTPENETKETEFSDLGISGVHVRSKMLWMQDEITGKIILSWQVEIQPKNAPDYWLVNVDAVNGMVLSKINLNISCSWSDLKRNHIIATDDATCNEIKDDNVATYNTYNTASVTGEESIEGLETVTSANYRVVPFPAESPTHPGGTPVLKNNPWLLAGAGNLAITKQWNDNGTTTFDSTRGNNVLAQDDRNGNNGNGLGGHSSTPAPNLNFDYTPNFALAPTTATNQQFALTNLFYWNNIVHDISYQYGFDEVSGNFQAKNFNRGGAQKDYVFADGQDGSGTDNANFSTPKDGQSPRMQMYLFSALPTFTVNAPASFTGLKTSTESAFSSNNKLSAKGPITNNVVLYKDNAADTSHRACGAAFNASALVGKIALIDRGGSCNFTVKVKNAQTAGAVAVIVADNIPGEYPITMGGTDNTITIPAIMVSFETGDTMKQILAASTILNVTMAAGVQLDGDLDNGVISHEYTHGISNRLTGGPTNVSCLTNREQMGEGWSDYMALMVTTNWSTAAVTDGTKARPMGTYVLGQPTTGAGIRVHPYSADMAINPWTYADLATQTGGEVHTIGEIWCNAIWEMTWNIIGQEGINTNIYNATGAGGNSIALKLVIQGMKLQPCKPGFIDGRNGILKADTLLYGGTYSALIWKAFAKRGMGIFASQGSSGSYTDGVADFTEPPAAAPFTQGSFDAVKQNNTAILQWQHLNNFKTGKVVIEKSTDAKNFTVVGTSDAGNRFVDVAPSTGKNYYRLSQAINSATIYSEVRTLNFYSISVTPNPAKDKVNITVAGNGKPLTIDLVNTVGHKIATYKMNVESMQINLPRIAPGVYYLKISGEQMSEAQKLIIE